MSETLPSARVYLERERPTELIELPYSAPSASTTLRRPVTIEGEHCFEVFQLTSAAEWLVGPGRRKPPIGDALKKRKALASIR